MTKREYAETIAAKVSSYIYGVTVKETPKENGVMYMGIMFPINDGNVAHIFYIEDQYKNNVDVEEVVNQILRTYSEAKNIGGIYANCLMDLLNDFSKAKEYIQPRLTGTKPDIPNIPFLDLFVYFVIRLSPEAFVKVNQRILDSWNISVDKIYEISKENVKSKCVTMSDMLQELIGEAPEVETLDSPMPMYVLTNPEKTYGAAAILKGELAKYNQTFYVLPSSVHEWIFIPTNQVEDVTLLSELVQEINATKVEPEDVLSNHAYFWNGTELEIA